MKLRLILLFGCLIVMSSCMEKPQATTQNYFRLREFILQQIALAEKQDWTIQKKVKLNEKEGQELESNPSWEDEWGMFIQADINKPAFQYSYTTDTVGNRIIYAAKPEENLEIKETIVELDDLKEPIKIFIRTENKNILFHTKRNLYIELKDHQITNYEIKGYQKIVLLNATEYLVRGEIIIPQTNR